MPVRGENGVSSQEKGAEKSRDWGGAKLLRYIAAESDEMPADWCVGVLVATVRVCFREGLVAVPAVPKQRCIVNTRRTINLFSSL